MGAASEADAGKADGGARFRLLRSVERVKVEDAAQHVAVTCAETARTEPKACDLERTDGAAKSAACGLV